MARSTKAAVQEETVEEVEEVEQTPKQIIAEAIDRFSNEVTVTGQHFRYKSLRAIAYQAFSNAIEDGTFDDLVTEAIANADDLPFGWEVERAEKAEAEAKPAKATKAPAKTAAKKAPAKAAPAKAPAKAPRKRPQR